MKTFKTSLAMLSACLLILSCGTISLADDLDNSNSIQIFSGTTIHFTPDNPAQYDTDDVTSDENGRVMKTTINLPTYDSPVTITAFLTVSPIPRDEVSVIDAWDRAGNIRLCRDGMADIELIKFITAYGGLTEYEVDLTALAPLLKGTCTFKAFIDTWLTPAWEIDLALVYRPVGDNTAPDWVDGVLFVESYTEKTYGGKGIEIAVSIPDDLKRVKLYYYTSGHCTDGTDADEFISKDNVIYVDDIAVYRYQPWRDDCRHFRDINPYTRRWSDGYWSSDYSRSGWCPGDLVEPLVLDLTDHLNPGDHKVRFVVEDVRPEDEQGHFGYWRLSGYLAGWKEK
ncbi:MAG: peptide-N-glycosidase F-related protein [Candidatus Zixiibacteriota bacterium]